jgi:hypothetical protein
VEFVQRQVKGEYRMYSRGHEQGTRKQRKPVQPWWAEQEEEAIRKVEREWAEKQAAQAKKEN